MDCKNKIFIINGYPLSGKDYLIDNIDEKFNIKSGRFSTVDLVKKSMEIFGYVENDKEIKDKFRAVLSDTKDSLDKHLDNITLKLAYKEAVKFNLTTELPTFIFSREPENIKKLVMMGVMDCIDMIPLLVESDVQKEVEFSNHADENVNNFDYTTMFVSTRDAKKYQENLDFFIINWL